MVFTSPDWVPSLAEHEIPDTVPICDFMLDDKHGRHPLEKSSNPFTCGITGRTYSNAEVKERVDFLARGLAKELSWSPNEGSEWDKVIAVFSLNTLDTVPLAWATHRLGGIQTPANAQYSVEELAYQLCDGGAKCIFTCLPLLETTLKAAETAKIPKKRIYILELPEALTGDIKQPSFKTVGQLISEGARLPPLEPLRWAKGESKRRAAFLCYSSGTSGLPKGVIISHYNVIANTMQINAFDRPSRQAMSPDGKSGYVENTLGLLPFSHIYALVVINHSGLYRGDGVIVLPKFDFNMYLQAIADHKIATLYLVPPIIILMAKNKAVLDKFDLSHVKTIYTGAAPLGPETMEDLGKLYPQWMVRQGYGLTETCTVVSSTSSKDIWVGSCGSVLPCFEVRLVDANGKDVTEYDTPGELLAKSPSIVLGYLKNPKANDETFVTDDKGGRWMRTGDEAVVRKAPSGHEHIFITDRIKELIKVKGHQVAPAELEAHLLTHPYVADCAVIAVPNDEAGEVPKAFVVKSPSIGIEDSDLAIKRAIAKHVEKHKTRYKWLKGGIEFVDVIPKSPSGKILRRMLRDKEKEKRRKNGAKL